MTQCLIAHRGYSAIAPENTIASFKAALTQPVWGVELDVHLSAEGVAVIIHDHTVDRTTNGKGNVAEHLIVQLQSLDAGSWFHPQFASETIPTLEQALALFSSTQIKLYIELKAECHWSTTAIQDLLKILSPVRDRCVIASFDHPLLTRINTEFPNFTVGYAVSNQTQYNPNYLETLPEKAKVILPHFSLILEQPAVTKALLNQDWDIVAWTVDDPKIAEELAEVKIIKIISNNLLQTE